MSESIDLSQVDDRDWFLQNLVNLVNARDVKLGITLNVGGFLVSGILVSGQKFFSGFGADLGSSFDDPEIRRGVEQAYAHLGDIYTPASAGSGGGAGVTTPPNYLHLMQAQFFQIGGAPIPGNKGVWWRGRISEVGGFFLGMLDAEET
jgi:hypothetical protein